MRRKGFRYNVGDVVPTNQGDVVILELYRDEKQIKKVVCQCKLCGTKSTKREIDLFAKKAGCSVCSGQKVVRGINDLWTTAPHIAEMLLNKDDGFNVTLHSGKKMLWKCPKCGNVVKNVSVYRVTKRGLSCSFCSDGISLPNRIMACILKNLQTNFVTEWTPTWAKPYRYDFYVPDKKLIIEMDGGFGHGNKGTDIEKKKQLLVDNNKDKLAKENGFDIIRVDCNYNTYESRYEYIINQIKISKLASIYDLEQLDFKSIIKDSCTSYILEACHLYRNGWLAYQISKHLSVCYNTVLRYIHIGEKCGMCSWEDKSKKYKEANAKKRAIYAIDNNENYKFFDSISNAALYYNIPRTSISACLNGRMKKCKEYSFAYAD